MRILIFGATGSIGQQTIDVIKKLQYQLVGISFFHHSCLAKKIKAEFKYSPVDKQISNVASYDELIKKSKPDLIVNAIVGFAGLEATLIALKHKIDLALANKESMVVAGQFVTKLAKTNKVTIYPIDSEHASLFQIIKQIKRKYQRLLITASGGPFYKLDYQALQKVNFQQAIKHPK
jgi:1-deoxy-D-xylulose-5-phosphate reductoisomerase